MSHSEQGEIDAAVAVRKCVGSAHGVASGASRANFHARVSDFVFLPERLSLEPVVPAYLANDSDFGLIVDWTISALIEAEALGITQDNVDSARRREDMRARNSGRRLRDGSSVRPCTRLGSQGDRRDRELRGNFRSRRWKAVSAGSRTQRAWTQGGLMTPAPMK